MRNSEVDRKQVAVRSRQRFAVSLFRLRRITSIESDGFPRSLPPAVALCHPSATFQQLRPPRQRPSQACFNCDRRGNDADRPSRRRGCTSFTTASTSSSTRAGTSRACTGSARSATGRSFQRRVSGELELKPKNELTGVLCRLIGFLLGTTLVGGYGYFQLLDDYTQASSLLLLSVEELKTSTEQVCSFLRCLPGV